MIGIVALGMALWVGSAAGAMLHVGFESDGSIPGDAAIGNNALRFANWTTMYEIESNSSILQKVTSPTLSAWVRADTINAWPHSIVFVSPAAGSQVMGAGRAHLQFLLEDQVVKLAAEASKTDSSPALIERAALSIPIDTFNAQWKGHWRHVAARFDYAARKVELYVDGQLAVPVHNAVGWTTSVQTTPNVRSATVTAGTGLVVSSMPVMPYNGDLDDISIYSSALPAEHIRALYELGMSAFNYDAAQVSELMAAHAAQSDWDNPSQPWQYIADLPEPTGALGTLYESDGITYLRLSSTTGMAAVPEPAGMFLLSAAAAALARRRRRAVR